MIKVVAKQTVKAGKLEEYLPIVRKLVEETNRNDAGCISYALYQETSDPQILTMLEEWEDQASIDAHLNSKHFLDAAPKLDALCSIQAEVNMYTKLF